MKQHHQLTMMCAHALRVYHRAVRKIFRYRTLRNYSEPMFVSARVVDKAIVVVSTA